MYFEIYLDPSFFESMSKTYPFLGRLEMEPESDSPLEEMVLQIPLSCKSGEGEGERDREFPPNFSIFSFFLEALLLILFSEFIIYQNF